MDVNTQIATVLSARDWSKSSKSLSEAIQRINSGKKILSPVDDARGIAEAEEIQSNQARLQASNETIKTGISYSQASMGHLQELHSTLNRMSELATQANGQARGSAQRGAYSHEFTQLAAQLQAVLGSDITERFDIINGFQASDSFSITINGKDFEHEVKDGDTPNTIRDALIKQINNDADASTAVQAYSGGSGIVLVASADPSTAVTYNSSTTGNTAVMNQSTQAGKPGGTFNGMELFADKAGSGPIINVGELETQTYQLPEVYLRVATNLFQLAGRNFDFSSEDLDTAALLQVVQGAQDEAAEAIGQMAGAESSLHRFHATNEVSLQNLESALSRFMDADVAEESSKMAKFNILSQSAVAMLAQANFGPQNVLSLLR